MRSIVTTAAVAAGVLCFLAQGAPVALRDVQLQDIALSSSLGRRTPLALAQGPPQGGPPAAGAPNPPTRPPLSPNATPQGGLPPIAAAEPFERPVPRVPDPFLTPDSPVSNPLPPWPAQLDSPPRGWTPSNSPQSFQGSSTSPFTVDALRNAAPGSRDPSFPDLPAIAPWPQGPPPAESHANTQTPPSTPSTFESPFSAASKSPFPEHDEPVPPVTQPPPALPVLIQTPVKGDPKTLRFITSTAMSPRSIYAIHVDSPDANIVLIRSWVSGKRWYNRAVAGPFVEPASETKLAALQIYVHVDTRVAFEVVLSKGSEKVKVTLTGEDYSEDKLDSVSQGETRWPFGAIGDPSKQPTGCLGACAGGGGGGTVPVVTSAFLPMWLGMSAGGISK